MTTTPPGIESRPSNSQMTMQTTPGEVHLRDWLGEAKRLPVGGDNTARGLMSTLRYFVHITDRAAGSSPSVRNRCPPENSIHTVPYYSIMPTLSFPVNLHATNAYLLFLSLTYFHLTRIIPPGLLGRSERSSRHSGPIHPFYLPYFNVRREILSR